MRPLFLLLIFLTLSCTPPASTLHPNSPNAPHVILPTTLVPTHPVPDGYVPGVANFGFISADLWRGAKPTRDGFQTLARMGVKTVIDLQEDDESRAIPAGVSYLRLTTSQWSADQVNVAAVLKAIELSPKPVFIHCHVGRDRTGLAVAAYRLAHGMNLTDALTELGNFHVNPWWRGGITRRLREFAA